MYYSTLSLEIFEPSQGRLPGGDVVRPVAVGLGLKRHELAFLADDRMPSCAFV